MDSFSLLCRVAAFSVWFTTHRATHCGNHIGRYMSCVNSLCQWMCPYESWNLGWFCFCVSSQAPSGWGNSGSPSSPCVDNGTAAWGKPTEVPTGWGESDDSGKTPGWSNPSANPIKSGETGTLWDVLFLCFCTCGSHQQLWYITQPNTMGRCSCKFKFDISDEPA